MDGGEGEVELGSAFRTWERAFKHLVRYLLHAFNDIRSRTQPRTGWVVEVSGRAADTARRVRAVDAVEGEMKVVDIAGVVDVSGQDSSNISEADVSDFSVNAV